jgi:hypothetical protein
MRIDPIERELLRARALDRWQDSKALRRDSERANIASQEARDRTAMLQERFSSLRERSQEALARAARLVEDATLLRGGVVHSTVIEQLADRALRELHLSPRDSSRFDRGVGLVATSDMGALLRVKELLGTRLPTVMGATDAGTALGLVIGTQPDLAVIDSRLELASGVDLALTLPLYAPATKALVLTDDAEHAHDLRVVGFDTERRHADTTTLLGWIDGAAA